LNKPVTRKPAGEINFYLIKNQEKGGSSGVVSSAALTLHAAAVSEQARYCRGAANKPVVFTLAQTVKSAYRKSGSQTDGIDFLFLY
jgi:hypothetical protein